MTRCPGSPSHHPDLRDTARAMSQENVEIDRQAVEAFNRHDFEAWLEHFDRTITWWAMTHEPEPGPFQGHEGVSKMAARWLDLLPDLRVEVKEYIDAGEYLVVPVRICGHDPDSDADVVGEEVLLNKYRDGRIVEVREYRTREEALEAVGLSEQDSHADS
jgi:ketosteroid isomerase-like protein